MDEELGRIVHGDREEVWTATIAADRRLRVRHEVARKTGGRDIAYLSPREVYASHAPRIIKDKLLAHVLYADTRSLVDDEG